MILASQIALGYAIFRGVQLAALTVPWLLQKVRRAEVTEAERSLVLMIGSRSILLGLAVIVLGVTHKREALAWVLMGDGLLQLFDTIQAVATGKRKMALLPVALCVLDGLASCSLLS